MRLSIGSNETVSFSLSLSLSLSIAGQNKQTSKGISNFIKYLVFKVYLHDLTGEFSIEVLVVALR